MNKTSQEKQDLFELKLTFNELCAKFKKEHFSDYEYFTFPIRREIIGECGSNFGNDDKSSKTFFAYSPDSLKYYHNKELKTISYYEKFIFKDLDILKLKEFFPSSHYYIDNFEFKFDASSQSKTILGTLGNYEITFCSKDYNEVYAIRNFDITPLLGLVYGSTTDYDISVYYFDEHNSPLRIHDLMKKIRPFISFESDEPKANAKIIMQKGNELTLVDNHVKSFDLEYDKHYNSDISDMMERMNGWDTWKQPNNRLCLFYGPAGTGKTNWIKNYIGTVNREVIFVPPSMGRMLGEPSFIEFMYEHKGALLVIEDAEQILEKREHNKDLAISSILNLTDGMLADFLDLRIICTHNKNKTWIDSALQRAGRCFCEYEFKKLTSDKAKALCLEEDVEWSGSEMTLGEIYNPDQFQQEESDFQVVGFQ